MPRLTLSKVSDNKQPNASEKSPSVKSATDSRRTSFASNTTVTSDLYDDETLQRGAGIEAANVSLDQLDVYIEYLYDDIVKKMRGAAAIRDLVTRDSQAFVIISTKDSLLSALSRVLVEDGRRSMELTASILFIFLSLSGIEELRQKMLQNRIGDATMKTMQREIGRFSLWKSEVETLLKQGSKSKQTAEKLEKLKLLLKRQDILFFVCINLLMKLGDDIGVEVKMVKRDIVGYLSSVLDIQLSKSYFGAHSPSSSSSLAKDAALNYQQQVDGVNPQVMIPLLSLLLRLTQFKENQMRILGLDPKFLQQLVLVAAKTSEKSIQVLALQILSNLSQTSAIKLKLLGCDGFLTMCSALISDPHNRVSTLALRLCYFQSMFSDGRAKIPDTSIIPYSMKKLLEATGPVISLELGALICNLAQDDGCLSIICGDSSSSSTGEPPLGFKLLMRRALKTMDPIIWKIMRTIASSPDEHVKLMFVPFIDEILKCCCKMDLKSLNSADDQEGRAIVLVCILGILGSLEIEEFDFKKLNERYDLLTIICSQILLNLNQTRNSLRNPDPSDSVSAKLSSALQPSDDLLLECLILLDTMLIDSNIIQAISEFRLSNPDSFVASPGRPSAASGRKSSAVPTQYNIPQLIMDVLQLKQDDPEIICSALKTVYSLLCNEEPCALFVADVRTVDRLLALSWDENEQVRTYASLCIDLLVDYERQVDSLLRISRVSREKRFQFHNAEWVLNVQDRVLESALDEVEQNERPETINRLSEGQGIMLADDEKLFDDTMVPDLEQQNGLMIQGQQIQFL